MADPSKVCGRDSEHEAVTGFLTSEVVEITRFTTTTHSGTRFTTSSDASSQHGRVEFVEQYLDVQKIPSDPLDGAASGSRDKSDRRAAERTYGSFKLLAKRASRYATLGWNGILGKNAGGQVDNSTASSSRVEQRYFPDSGSGDDESEMLARGGKSPITSIEEVSGDNLSSTQRGVNEIPIVAIVGMPGIGKTTLAQLVFNDNRIQQWFELRSWVWVPYPFQMKDVMKDIVNSIQFHGDPQSLAAGESLASLQQNLLVKIGKQKLLLVLDNVWSGHDIWETLLVPLQSAAPGCRIIVTTRDKKVANALNAEFILPIAELSEEDCWKVVRKTALPHDTSLDSELERVGWKIAERCKGLPLAAKTFGGILRPSVNMQSWEEISRREIWNLPEGGERLIKSLLLSYQNLSPQPNQCSPMMRCFAYCSIFPKGHMFQRERLVLLWVAEGFVKDVGSSTEAIADGHFRDLVSKFLLRESNCNESNPPTFMMHDMIHDLARYVMRGIGFLEHPRDTHEISSRTRHFTFRQSKTDNEGSLRILSELNCLRTFLPLPSKQFDGRSNCCLSKTVLVSLIERGSHLRVLSLANYKITDLPDPKGKLKYLRYLDLSNTLICSLPKPVFGLGFLQTLWLTDCVHLTSLPVDLGSQLPRLRHLDIRGCKLQRPLQERRGLKIVHSRRGLNMLPLR